jgi:hypothetical protein
LIFVSGLLVLGAAALLIVGIVSSLSFVYAAIALSIVAGVVLIIGVFHHPVQEAPAGKQDALPTGPEPEPPVETPHPAVAASAGATGAAVVVVSGRPRYHLSGCEYVAADQPAQPVISLSISEARELGFTPCGGCRPDQTLAAGQS